MSCVLINYRHTGAEPLKCITQLPYEKAVLAAEKIYADFPCPAHRRFGPDFPDYFAYRMDIEKRLYKEFLALGGTPEIEHPYYFSVGHCESLYHNFKNGEAIIIPLDDIQSEYISFTLGDSMVQEERKNTQPVFRKEKLLAMLAEHENNVESLISSIKEEYICIEAQLWSDKFFR